MRIKGQIQTQKHGFTVNFAPKNIVILHIFYPKIWVTIFFGHKFDSKELFLRYYIIEQRENGNCSKFLPPKMGSSCLQILDPKIWLSRGISDPKNMARTPAYANMASSPSFPGLRYDLVVAVILEAISDEQRTRIFMMSTKL